MERDSDPLGSGRLSMGFMYHIRAISSLSCSPTWTCEINLTWEIFEDGFGSARDNLLQ